MSGAEIERPCERIDRRYSFPRGCAVAEAVQAQLARIIPLSEIASGAEQLEGDKGTQFTIQCGAAGCRPITLVEPIGKQPPVATEAAVQSMIAEATSGF